MAGREFDEITRGQNAPASAAAEIAVLDGQIMALPSRHRSVSRTGRCHRDFLVPGVGMLSFAKGKTTARISAEPKPRAMQGRVAFITGGAGGIGSASAERLLRDGCNVVLADIDQAALEDVVAGFAKRFGRDMVRGTRMDVTGEAKVIAALDYAVAEYGGLDVVNPDAVLRGSKIWQGEWSQQRAASNKIAVSDLEEHYRKRSLLQRSVFPEDIAEAVYFFASDLSSKSTGNFLNVDAGNPVSFPR